MKINYSFPVYKLSIGVLLAFCLMMSSCKKGSEETVQEKALKMLTGVWHVSTVSVDNVDKTSLFTGLVLTIAPGTYTTTSNQNNPVWPASGTWSFTDAKAVSFTRDDGVVVNITSLTNTSLTLTLQWNKTTLGGRVSSVSGSNVFNFSK